MKIEKALDDLKTIQETLGNIRNYSVLKNNLKVALKIQIFAFILAVLILIQELYTKASQTSLILSVKDEMVRNVGIWSFIFLAVLIVISSLLLTIKNFKQIETSEYIQKELAYSSFLSFFSDIVIKMLVIIAILIAKQPAWFAPALLCFIADYVMQGRFFHFSYKIGSIVGCLCFIIAGIQIYLDSITIIPLMITFILLSFYSILKIKSEIKDK